MNENAQHHSGEENSAEGTMDISEHIKTWEGFWAGVKWSSVGLIVLAVLLAIFRTNQ
jgi:hypothetical protein